MPESMVSIKHRTIVAPGSWLKAVFRPAEMFSSSHTAHSHYVRKLKAAVMSQEYTFFNLYICTFHNNN